MKELTLGQKIRNYRKQAGLSQLDLEMEIGASAGTISRIENGQVNPTKETVFAIAEVLKLPEKDIADLFGIPIVDTVSNFIEVDEEISNVLDLKDLCRMITNKTLTRIGTRYSTVWLWDPETSELKLASVSAPMRIIGLVEKIINTNVLNLVYYPFNNDYEHNLIAQAFARKKTTIAKNFLEISYPYVKSDLIAKPMQRILEMKYSISTPIRFQGKVIGVLGLIWQEDVLRFGLVEEIELLASKFGRAIHNAQEFEDMRHRIEALEGERKA